MSEEFVTTRWTLVLGASSGEREASEALQWLCEAYWFPLYSYTRRKGHDVDGARDLIQAFFLDLLTRDSLTQVDPKLGKFRAFLLAALKNFASKQRAHERATKRHLQGSIGRVSLDDAETRHLADPDTSRDPAQLFERRWAITVLQRALKRLSDEHQAAGKEELFRHLRGYATGESELSYRALAERLGLTEGAVKVAVHRLRVRLGEILRDEVAQTVLDPKDVDDELRHLLATIAGG